MFLTNVLLIMATGASIATLLRIKRMSDDIDSELADFQAASARVTEAVNHAAAKFADLALKLRKAIEDLQNMGLSPDHLAKMNAIQAELNAESDALTGAADEADPAAAETVSAPVGDDTVSDAGGDNTVEAGGGDNTVTAPVEALSLLTTSLPDAVAGQGYTSSLSASGGVAPYSYLVSPPTANGVTINEFGSVSGTPLTDGDVDFSVVVSDVATPPNSASGHVTLHTAADTNS